MKTKKQKVKKSYEKFHEDIKAIVKEHRSLLKRAETLGLFVEDRDLLECPKCGLLEDVTADGVLIVYRPGQDGIDSGLRFKKMKKNPDYFLCPDCKTKIKDKWDSLLDRLKPRAYPQKSYTPLVIPEMSEKQRIKPPYLNA